MKQVKRFLVQEVVSTDVEKQACYWHYRVELEDGKIEDDFFHCPFDADERQQWLSQRRARQEYAEVLRRPR